MKHDTIWHITPAPAMLAADGVDSHGRRKTSPNASGARLFKD